MKFFNSIQIKTLRSSYQQGNSAYLCDVQDTVEQSRQSNYRYSTHHNQLPKSVEPGSVSSTPETLVGDGENCGLSTALPNYSHSKKGDIQCEGERDLYSQRLAKWLHFPNYKSELSSLYNGLEHHQQAHDNDISLSKPNGHTNDLHYENYTYIHS
jgi:hypothetical protein